MINIVFAGDEASGVDVLYNSFVQATSNGVGEEPPFAQVVHCSLQTTPPTTLQSSVDLVVLCYSPTHPGTFVRLSQHYLPAYAHISSARFALAACRVELTVNTTVQKKMEQLQMVPIFPDEAEQLFASLGAQAALVADDRPMLFAVSSAVRRLQDAAHRGDEAGKMLMWKRSPSILMTVNALRSWCQEGSPKGTPAEGSHSHFDDDNASAEKFRTLTNSSLPPFRIQLDDVLAGAVRMYHERASLQEWIELILPSSSSGGFHRPLFVNRASGEITATKPPAALVQELTELLNAAALIPTGSLTDVTCSTKDHQKEVDYATRFESVRCGTLKTTQAFLLRKAVAAAEKNRQAAAQRLSNMRQRPQRSQIDKSAVMRSLQSDVDDLTNRLAALMDLRQRHEAVIADADAVKAETIAHQQWLEEESAACRAVEAETLSQRAVLQRLEAMLVEYDVLSGEAETLPGRNAATMKLYLTEWNVSKKLRAERDAIELKTQRLEEESRRVYECSLAPLESRIELLGARVDDQFSFLSEAQTKLLALTKESWIGGGYPMDTESVTLVLTNEDASCASSRASQVYRHLLHDACAELQQAALGLTDAIETFCTAPPPFDSPESPTTTARTRDPLTATSICPDDGGELSVLVHQALIGRLELELDEAVALLAEVQVPFGLRLLETARAATSAAFKKMARLT